MRASLVIAPLQEVGETFLRCVKERFAETNAVIELNGLKIAEDRTFADCARYMLTAMLQVSSLHTWKRPRQFPSRFISRYLISLTAVFPPPSFPRLQLCLPHPAWVPVEYHCLYPTDVPDAAAKEGKLALLLRFKKQLSDWGSLLRRFLRSEDDQVCQDVSLVKRNGGSWRDRGRGSREIQMQIWLVEQKVLWRP
jgi:translation initiation factor eIF-2B subunit epsilon